MPQQVEKFRVALPGRTLEADLNPDVAVSSNPEGLSEALADQPGKFAWWAVLEAEAKALVEQLENARDARYADLYARHSEGGTGDGKRTPVEAVKTAVARDPGYRKILDQLQQANRQAGLLGAAKRAMEHRKEALLAIGSNYRAELDAGQRNALRARGTVYGGRG